MSDFIERFANLRKRLQSLDADLRASWICDNCGKPTCGILPLAQATGQIELCTCPAEAKRERQVKPFPPA